MVIRTFTICVTPSGKQKKKNKNGDCPTNTKKKTVRRNIGKRHRSAKKRRRRK